MEREILHILWVDDEFGLNTGVDSDVNKIETFLKKRGYDVIIEKYGMGKSNENLADGRNKGGEIAYIYLANTPEGAMKAVESLKSRVNDSTSHQIRTIIDYGGVVCEHGNNIYMTWPECLFYKGFFENLGDASRAAIISYSGGNRHAAMETYGRLGIGGVKYVKKPGANELTEAISCPRPRS